VFPPRLHSCCSQSNGVGWMKNVKKDENYQFCCFCDSNLYAYITKAYNEDYS